MQLDARKGFDIALWTGPDWSMDATERAARTKELNDDDDFAHTAHIIEVDGQRIIEIQQTRLTADEAYRLAGDLESRASEIDSLNAIDQLQEGTLVTFKAKNYRLYGTIAKLGYCMLDVEFFKEYADNHDWLRGQRTLSWIDATRVEVVAGSKYEKLYNRLPEVVAKNAKNLTCTYLVLDPAE
jgi:hypothetical protein